MATDIGNLYPTKVPSLSDNADIQEAFRLYHYGAASTVYNPLNENEVNLQPQSIAYYLNNLQDQITNVSGSLGVQSITWTAKGSIVTATASGILYSLPVGASNGMVLTVKSSATAGIDWIAPEVLADNVATLTNKTLTAPKFGSAGYIADINGLPLISFPTTVSSAVNYLTISNAATGNKPSLTAAGSDTNITLNLVSKGTGTVQINGSDVPTLAGIQTFTNKTLSNPTITNDLYMASVLSTPSKIVFEGTTDDSFETILSVIDPTADRVINLPNIDGTVITTGNLSSITTVGTVTSGIWNSTAIGTTFGGTGLSSYTTGDIIYASGTNTLATRAAGINGYILTMVSGVPQWAVAPAGYTAPVIGSTTITSGGTFTTLPGVTSVNGTTIPLNGTLITSTTTTLSAVTSVNGTTIPLSGGTALVTTAASQSVSGNLVVTGNLIGHITINPQTGTTYTVVASDDGKIIEMSNASANTITIPNLSTLPVGTQITILQTNIGQTTIAAGTNVTVNGTPGLKLRAQWSSATLIKRVSAVAPSNDIWVLVGDLTA